MPNLPCPNAASQLRNLSPRDLRTLLFTPFYSNTGPPASWLDPIVWQLEVTPFIERTTPPAPPLRSMTNGPPVSPPQDPLVAWDPFDCFWWTVCNRAVYSPDWSQVEKALQARGRLGLFKHHDSGPGLLDPAFAWATLPDRFTVIVRGTDQTSQAANYVVRHAYDATVGMPGWGSVNESWVDGGLVVAGSIQADWVAAGRPPLCFVGHSYGAPCAAVAMMQLTDPGRNAFDRLVTLGAPLWGTQSLAKPWAQNQHMRLVTAGDPIVQIPPPASIVSTLLAIGVLPAAALGRYYHLAPGLLLTPQNGIVPLSTTDLSAIDWLTAVAGIATGQTGFDPHLPGTYADLAAAWIALNPIPLPQGWDDFPSLLSLNSALAAGGL